MRVRIDKTGQAVWVFRGDVDPSAAASGRSTKNLRRSSLLVGAGVPFSPAGGEDDGKEADPAGISTLRVLALAYFGVSLPMTALAYDTGAMSCDDIGEYAAAVVEGKENGKTLAEAYAVISRTVPSNYVTERRIFSAIVRQIYTAAYAKHLTADGAFASYKAECDAQQ